MTTQEIHLDFAKTITGIAGFPFGQQTFDEQVKDNINLDQEDNYFIIVFPKNIERISSSFIQGFFSELIEKYGYYYIKEKIKLDTFSEELSQSVFEVLE